MKKGTVIVTAVLVAGCATGADTRDSEDLQYRRESERVEALEQYQMLRRSCTRSGGILFVQRHNGGRLAGTPTAQELKSASCSPPTLF